LTEFSSIIFAAAGSGAWPATSEGGVAGRATGPDGVGAGFAQAAEQRANLNLGAFLRHDLGQGAGGGRVDLNRHLVGLKLDQRLVGGNHIPDLLQPARDGCSGHALAQRGHLDFGRHDVLVQFQVFKQKFSVRSGGSRSQAL
jgi:hypothetical protein